MTRVNVMGQALARAVLTALVVLNARCALLEGRFEEVSDVEAALREEQERERIPSISAAVVRDGAVAREVYLGQADLDHQVPAGESTIYCIASVSKLVILTAALQLWESGRLDLEADVSGYLPFRVRNPRFPDEPITCRHLMTHTSGLAWPNNEVPGFYEPYPCDSAPELARWLPDFILPSGGYYFPAVWKDAAPGNTELYSNIGASLLAYVVERVSGTPFADYCRDSIFLPLGMTRTSYRFRDLPGADLAQPYNSDISPVGQHSTLAWPSADLKTTVHDFARFMLAWMNRGEYEETRILEPGTVDKALEMRNPASGRCLIWLRGLGDWYGHTGGVPGFAAVSEFQRPTGVAVIVFANMRHPSVYQGGRIHALLRRMACGQHDHCIKTEFKHRGHRGKAPRPQRISVRYVRSLCSLCFNLTIVPDSLMPAMAEGTGRPPAVARAGPTPSTARRTPSRAGRTILPVAVAERQRILSPVSCVLHAVCCMLLPACCLLPTAY